MKKNLIKKTFVVFIFALTSILFAGCGQTKINVFVDGIEISKKNLYLAEGQTAVISAQVYPFNANNQNYTFESSNTNVVTCEDGFVVAKKAGDAVIYVFSEEGGYKDSCNVLVTTASNNLKLNNYNNLNMPEKELTPLFDADNKNISLTNTQPVKNYNEFNLLKNHKTNKQKFNKDENIAQIENKDTKNNSLFSKIKKYATKRINSEINDDVQSGKNVLNQFKTEFQDSISNLQKQRSIYH